MWRLRKRLDMCVSYWLAKDGLIGGICLTADSRALTNRQLRAFSKSSEWTPIVNQGVLKTALPGSLANRRSSARRQARSERAEPGDRVRVLAHTHTGAEPTCALCINHVLQILSYTKRTLYPVDRSVSCSVSLFGPTQVSTSAGLWSGV